MGERWSQFKVGFKWPKISEFDAAQIADAHNADCGEYEKRIDALTDQLTRARDEIKRAKRAADPVALHLNNALAALEPNE